MTTSNGHQASFYLRFLYPLIFLSCAACGAYESPVRQAERGAPYPSSPVIQVINWNFKTLARGAPGSDIWATTWADDGNLYTSWGDGGGFGGTNFKGRVSMGVARLKGEAENWKGFNVWGGLDPESGEKPFPGKPGGMLSVDGVLYMSVIKQDVWTMGKMAKSMDHGRTWTSGGWDFKSPFSAPAFLNFGKDYEGARDQFVYSYASDRENLILARVPKDRIMSRNAYEFFAGWDEGGRPLWASDIGRRRSFFSDPNGLGWPVQVVYNAGIRRYLLSVFHGPVPDPGDGSWGLFDAPEPWGPWTTVAYYKNWIDSTPKFGFEFPSKWMSPDGKTLWMVFSGTDIYDSFNVIGATLILKTQ